MFMEYILFIVFVCWECVVIINDFYIEGGVEIFLCG